MADNAQRPKIEYVIFDMDGMSSLSTTRYLNKITEHYDIFYRPPHRLGTGLHGRDEYAYYMYASLALR